MKWLQRHTSILLWFVKHSWHSRLNTEPKPSVFFKVQGSFSSLMSLNAFQQWNKFFQHHICGGEFSRKIELALVSFWDKSLFFSVSTDVFFKKDWLVMMTDALATSHTVVLFCLLQVCLVFLSSLNWPRRLAAWLSLWPQISQSSNWIIDTELFGLE